MIIPFRKMNGAGNDFVIFDAREQSIHLTLQQICKIADKKNPLITKGCDQVIVMEPSSQANVFMRIYNADGSEVNACGNATRCIAWLIIQERNTKEAIIETKAGLLPCRALNYTIAAIYNDLPHIEVDMGTPKYLGDLKNQPGFDAVYDNIDVGNPHIVFFTSVLNDMDKIDDIGPPMQKIKNVTIAKVDPNPANGIFSYVWERGVGRTASCGTAACATAIAAIQYNPSYGNDIRITQHMNSKSNMLKVNWNGTINDHVFLTGPVEEEFEGEIAL